MAAVLPDGRLRHVEKDILIAKMVKEEATKRCHKYSKAFGDCARGRTVSMVWKCRKESQELQDCIAKHAKDEQLWEECTAIYLKRRDEYQQRWKEQHNQISNDEGANNSSHRANES